MKTKYRDLATFNLRMQSPLKVKLKDAADKKKPKWSLNSEIEERLEKSFETRRELDKFTDGELIDELIKRWGREHVLVRLGKLEE